MLTETFSGSSRRRNVPSRRRSERRADLFLRLMKALVLLLWAGSPLQAAEETVDVQKARERMVRTQIQARGIVDQSTRSAMGQVPRHRFVPEAFRATAYDDRPLPIGYGQTISQPYIVAYMTEVVRPGPGRKILEIGTGSGYQAAVLAETGAEVYTVEIIPELAKEAADRLHALGYQQVSVRQADGYFGWPEKGPFDAIVVTAAAESVPPPLLKQLKDGGRMIIPVGSPFLVQSLMLIEKHGEEITTRNLLPVRFVPFRRTR